MDAPQKTPVVIPTMNAVKLNIFLGLALFVSLLLNLASSSIKSLLAIAFLILAILIFAPYIARKAVQLLRNTVCKFLQQQWVEIDAIVRQTAAFIKYATITLAVQIECGFQAVCQFIQGILQPLVKKIRLLFKGEDGPHEENVNTKQIPKKVVLIVSLPYGRSYSKMKEILELEPPKPPFIDWRSNQKANIPPIIPPRTSIRHFALCIVPIEAWDDPLKTLSQKFHYGKFWELVGPDVQPKEGDCVGWNNKKIKSIDGMVDLGTVTHSDDYVSEQFYRPLQNAWDEYRVVWWNSFDFSIRLAYMLQFNASAKGKLGDIHGRIQKQRVDEVKRAEKRLARKACAMISLALVANFPILLGGAVYSGYKIYIHNGIKPGSMDEWRKLSKSLEGKFPQLQGLVDDYS